MSEERDDLVVLIGEDGEEIEFEYLDTIEMNDNEYVVLIPLEPEEEQDENTDEVVILRIEHVDGEDSFVGIDDDKELNAVFDEFKSRMENDYYFDEEEEE